MIDPADFLEQGFQRVGVVGVCLAYFEAAVRDLFGVVDVRGGAACDPHFRALLGGGNCRGEADAGCASDNDDVLAGQVTACHGVLLLYG